MAVIRGPEPYTFADAPTRRRRPSSTPGQRCTTTSGEELAEAMDLGVRTWGNSRDGALTMLVGTYERRREVSQRMLEALPQLVVLRRGGVGLTARRPARRRGRQGRARTGARPRPAARPARHRRRAGVVRPGGDAGAGVVPGARRPGRREGGAHAAPQPRAPLDGRRPGRRGRHVAGRAGPALHRARRRAADVVPHRVAPGPRRRPAAEPGATVGSVARQVGYGSPFALSTAFKRVHGISPRQHRALATA